MRRGLLTAVLLAAVALLVWWALQGGPGADTGARVGTGATAVEADATDPAAAKTRPRDRAKTARAGDADDPSLPGFLRKYPEIGQDRDQDPSLGALRGKVFAAQGVPATEFVVEAATRTQVEARARVLGRSEFLLKNVRPGGGICLSVRAEGFAPGGADKLIVRAGQTTDVGTVYLGAALDPDATNRLDVVVLDNGRPLKGVLVTVTSVPFRTLLALGNLEKLPGGTILRAETDDLGGATFEKLPPAGYDVLAEAEGFAFAYLERQLFQRATQTAVRIDLRPGLTIEGRAVTPDQEPVAGARVVCMRFGGAFPMVPPAMTDAEGRFVVKGLEGGPHLLIVAKEDVGGREVQGVLAGTKDLLVEIPAGVELWVRCTDARTGAPIREFGVRPFRKAPFAYLFSPLFEARSETGEFRQKLLPSADYGLEVSAPGYALANVAKVAFPCAEPIEVKLEPAGVIRGRVVSRGTDLPIRGAAVFVKRGGFPPSPVKDQQTVTDGEGVFTLDHLPPTPISITISHPDHDEKTFDSVATVVAAPGSPPPAPRAFELGSGGRIAGRVARPDGTPVSGATISLHVGIDFTSSRTVLTDESGAFAFDNVAAGSKYTVSLGGSVPGVQAKSRMDVRVTEGETTTVDFADSGGQRIAGRVVRDEHSVANAAVTIVAADGSSYTGSARSGPDGTFGFDNVPPGRYVVRVAAGAQGSRVADVTVPADAPPAEVVLVLSAAAISGKVVDRTTGEPLGGAWCDCNRIVERDTGGLSDLLRSGAGQRATGPDGLFTFPGLEDGSYRVRVIRDGYGVEMTEDLVVLNGEVRQGVTIALGPACTVTGFVRDAQGLPVQGAALLLRDGRGRQVFPVSLTSSEGDGRFVQGGLRPDTYELTFEKDGYAPCVQSVTVATSERPVTVDFTLLKGGSVEVTVRDGDGKTVRGAVVTLHDAAGARVTRGITASSVFSTNLTTTDADGKFTFSGLAAGVYEVRAGRAGAAAVSRPGVEVHEAQTTPADVVLPTEAK